ncbi:thymidine kinase [Thermosipho melanesiensis]|uniref:Thymidine kinase n=2 Tax=Thermosipho melanesiensis TaxID=46541 RepID=A6LMA9_THEM4|nr:thymidine kinase [Thermosipho melanesiensis]ABR31060.1 Thymidine kinase [Thermosipho melanesiensis BI429]APT74154.1 thymidine kinase [Thermosipho melanesiensis]OOC36100.1 thymidine kinase [Thermosipho melanesiensis]OOC36917.1 thymidine kinase [Thermosipho melanesiensis]OOC37668.1 thymidine kinase [Thermosipho melanesiensis]
MVGKITVITGPMYSGKTTELLSFVEIYNIGRKKTIVFKPSIDNRYGEDIVSTHTGFKVSAIRISKSREILDYIRDSIDAVFVDEIQFFDLELVDVVKELVFKGIDVYCAGLDISYLENPFETTAKLLAMADEVIKKKAVCEKCGEHRATYSYKIIPNGGEIDVGGKEKYIALCRKCLSEIKKQEVIL